MNTISKLLAGRGMRPPTPTPPLTMPGYGNPLAKKRPKTPTPIPGVPDYTGLPATPFRRNTLLGN